jgi:hypothetical protein
LKPIVFSHADRQVPPPAVPTQFTRGNGFMNVSLFLCVLSGFFVIVQPAPYEGFFFLLAIACFAARTKIDLTILLMIALLTILQLGALASALPVLHDADVQSFLVTSIYLSLTAPIFAFVMTSDTERRLSIYRTAFLLSAVIASVLGAIGFFQPFPGAEVFMMNGRAVATFKDPNGLGPYLIPPLLLALQRIICDRMRLLGVVSSLIIATGLLLAFSRGAWGNFVVSIALMIVLLLVTSPEKRIRTRLFFFVVLGAIGVAILLIGLLSIDTVRQMFEQRFTLLQEYDTGTSGARFSVQAYSIDEILRNPNGMGPWIFAKKYGLVPHNSYLSMMLNHGWMGGITYIALVLTTFVAGLRCAFIRTPWQGPLIALYASYVGLALESLIVDTDHSRLYFQLLGVLWGLIAMTVKFRRDMHAPALPRYLATASN